MTAFQACQILSMFPGTWRVANVSYARKKETRSRDSWTWNLIATGRGGREYLHGLHVAFNLHRGKTEYDSSSILGVLDQVYKEGAGELERIVF